MEQFSLDKWLQDKNRKVVTRDRRPVRILCTDAKAKDGCCIIAAIETDGEEEGYQFFKDGKAYSSKSSIEDCADLFFADEDEFESTMISFSHAMFDHLLNSTNVKVDVKEWKNKLLDLARKEIEKEITDLVKKELLKDLPKWKKATEHKKLGYYLIVLDTSFGPCLNTEVFDGDYYIDLEDLQRLPKEE